MLREHIVTFILYHIMSQTPLSKTGCLDPRWMSHILANKSERVSVLIVVGRVINDHVFCGPAGNCHKKSIGSLKTASISSPLACRYRLLAADFENRFQDALQNPGRHSLFTKTGATYYRRDDKFRNIRFSANGVETRPTVSLLSIILISPFLFIAVDIPQSRRTLKDETPYLSDVSTTLSNSPIKVL